MSLYLEEEGNVRLKLDTQALAEQVVESALTLMGCPFEAEVSLLLTTDGGIREINRQQRNLDRPTDVLSFPMLSLSRPADWEEVGSCQGAFHPETGELLLGDIVLSKDRVAAQAEEYGHSLCREYAFLLVHSLLHLLGYDHQTPEEARQMEALQEELLQKMGITREEGTCL